MIRWLALLPLCCTLAAAQKPAPIVVPNPSGVARAMAVISHDVTPARSVFTVRATDGRDVPAAYDRKTRKLLILDALPAAGATYQLIAGRRSRAGLPRWPVKITKDRRITLFSKRRVQLPSARIGNGVFELTVPRGTNVSAQLQIRALEAREKGGPRYTLRLQPLGWSSGCIDEARHAADIEATRATGKPHPQLFNITAGVPTKIEVSAPNPFVRVLTVRCFGWARKNNGQTSEPYKTSRFEVVLTWGSPVIGIRCRRELARKYYNHNGVFTSDIATDGLPLKVTSDDERGEREVSLRPGQVHTAVPFRSALLLHDRTGRTVVYQPDFAKNGVHRPCVVATADRLLTVISHSWRMGWKPIELPARRYDDDLWLVCDVGPAKTLGQWIAELAGPESKD